MVLRSQILAHKAQLPSAEQALPGRAQPLAVPAAHHVNGHALQPPFRTGLQQAIFAMGCFWGAERRFWQQPGVWSTAVGYAGGFTPNPPYEETRSGPSRWNCARNSGPLPSPKPRTRSAASSALTFSVANVSGRPDKS